MKDTCLIRYYGTVLERAVIAKVYFSTHWFLTQQGIELGLNGRTQTCIHLLWHCVTDA